MQNKDILYLDWLYNIVCHDGAPLSYKKLFEEMLEIPFYPRNGYDLDRWQDGVNLRRSYYKECNQANKDIPIQIISCSILEMMIALAIEIECEIMSDPSRGDRTAEWFWEMMASLGIASYDDSAFDEFAASDVARKLNVLNCQLYESNGAGGLFTLEKNVNAPKMPIWDQAMAYVNIVLKRTNK